MHHRLRVHAVAALIAAATGPAAADVLVNSATQAERDRLVHALGTIEVVLHIGINATFTADTLVTALAVATATSAGLGYDSQVSASSTTDATIVDALRANAGLVLLNQQAGVHNAQANVVALGEAQDLTTAVHARATGEQSQAGAVLRETAADGAAPEWSAVAAEALSGQSGITAVNQAVGVANNQHTALATAAAVDRPSSIADTLLLQTIGSGFVESNGGRRRSAVTDALNGNEGVTILNQAAGFANNQAAVFGLPFFIPLGVLTAIGPSGIIQR